MYGRREIIAAVSAAVLFVGTVAFAASAPLANRPSSDDLPVITIGRTTTPAVTTTDSATPAPEDPAETTETPDVPAAQPGDEADDEHEVVAPPIRDDDPESDDAEIEHDDGADKEDQEPSETPSHEGDSSETDAETEPDGE